MHLHNHCNPLISGGFSFLSSNCGCDGSSFSDALARAADEAKFRKAFQNIGGLGNLLGFYSRISRRIHLRCSRISCILLQTSQLQINRPVLVNSLSELLTHFTLSAWIGGLKMKNHKPFIFNQIHLLKSRFLSVFLGWHRPCE